MYLRLVIAGSLGLLWYFSDCGRALAQLFIFLLFCFSTPLLCASGGRENSTQTDEETSKHPLLVNWALTAEEGFIAGEDFILMVYGSCSVKIV